MNATEKLGENNMASSIQKSTLQEEPHEHRHWFHIGFVTNLILPLSFLFLLALVLFVIENKLDINIPHRILTTTALWMIVSLVAIWIFSQNISSENLRGMDEKKVITLRKTVIGFLLIVMIFGALAKLGIDLSGYLIGLGFTAVIIGFASQSLISNFISGVLVYIEKTIKIGEYIRVNIPTAPIEGTIEEMSFLRTRIVTNDGVRISIPNTILLTTTISNFTIKKERPLNISLSISAKQSLDNVKKQLTKAIKKNFGTEDVSRMRIKGIQENKINIDLWIMVNTSQFLREREKVIQNIDRICRNLNLKLHSLTTS